MNIHTVGHSRCTLSDDVTKDGHHSNTSVHDLGFAKALDLPELHILGETQWIEEAKGCNSTGQSITGKLLIRDPSIEWSTREFIN